MAQEGSSFPAPEVPEAVSTVLGARAGRANPRQRGASTPLVGICDLGRPRPAVFSV